MSKIIKAPRGTFDILPEDAGLWQMLEGSAREAFRRYGYSEIRTPLAEQTRLFVRGIGDTTDIVEKEMYTFDGKGREGSISLRPEATAGVVRAYIEHNYHKKAPLQKFCYMGEMFRYERPQAGRQRQFSQIGVEVLGTHMPEADVETIALALCILAGVGLSGMKLKINSMGCPACRERYLGMLRKFIGEHVEKLCPDCKRRHDRNPLRVLDCKVESCKAILVGMPEMNLCGECTRHHETVLGLLTAIGIEYIQDKFLVRGFDYYTRTVYEIVHPALGARDAVAGGGRYDNLVEELGGPPTGAVGFSIGCEATLLALVNSGGAWDASDAGRVEAYMVFVDESVRGEAFKTASILRKAGIQADMSFEAKSVKSQMRSANRQAAKLVVILGPEEVEAGEVKVKDMETGVEEAVKFSDMVSHVRNVLKGRETER